LLFATRATRANFNFDQLALLKRYYHIRVYKSTSKLHVTSFCAHAHLPVPSNKDTNAKFSAITIKRGLAVSPFQPLAHLPCSCRAKVLLRRSEAHRPTSKATAQIPSQCLPRQDIGSDTLDVVQCRLHMHNVHWRRSGTSMAPMSVGTDQSVPTQISNRRPEKRFCEEIRPVRKSDT
jgi:hypothetical protein